jgi:hypothetical protein
VKYFDVVAGVGNTNSLLHKRRKMDMMLWLLSPAVFAIISPYKED